MTVNKLLGTVEADVTKYITVLKTDVVAKKAFIVVSGASFVVGGILGVILAHFA